MASHEAGYLVIGLLKRTWPPHALLRNPAAMIEYGGHDGSAAPLVTSAWGVVHAALVHPAPPAA
jgi:hypothetical protein